MSSSSIFNKSNDTNNISMFNPMNNLNLMVNDNDNKINKNNQSIINVSSDSEILFNESVPIHIRTSIIETKTRELTLKIEKMLQLPQNQQILSITLTDEVIYFFCFYFSY